MFCVFWAGGSSVVHYQPLSLFARARNTSAGAGDNHQHSYYNHQHTGEKSIMAPPLSDTFAHLRLNKLVPFKSLETFSEIKLITIPQYLVSESQIPTTRTGPKNVNVVLAPLGWRISSSKVFLPPTNRIAHRQSFL